MATTRTFLINRPTGTKYRLNGVQPSEELPAEPDLKRLFSDYQLIAAGELPPAVDLRPYMTAVENQSKTACW